MKRLLLWRHAKASAGDPRGDDADRELAERGVEGAAAMAAHFHETLAQSQLILCSPAVRTRQTLSAVEAWLDSSTTIRFERGLYLASHLELLDRMARVEEEHGTLLVIGHNPGIEELVRHLISEGDEASLERFAGGFKAGALARGRRRLRKAHRLSPTARRRAHCRACLSVACCSARFTRRNGDLVGACKVPGERFQS